MHLVEIDDLYPLSMAEYQIFLVVLLEVAKLIGRSFEICKTFDTVCSSFLQIFLDIFLVFALQFLQALGAKADVDPRKLLA
jgi:hypothetical protein